MSLCQHILIAVFFILQLRKVFLELTYAREELEFLLYWYKAYGKVIIPK